MAIMVPKRCKQDTTDGEKKIHEILELGLGDEIVCYHNKQVDGGETDFIVILPGEGICVIEVKDWTGIDLTCDINNNQFIYFNYKTHKEERVDSPLGQCKNYTYSLINLIKGQLNLNVKVVPLIAFPYMNEAVYKEKGVDKLIARKQVILRDDIENISNFRYVVKEKFNQKVVKRAQGYSQAEYIKICSNFESEESIRKRLAQIQEARKVDRLFEKRTYSILSFLRLKTDEEAFKAQIEPFYRKWIIGCKVILVLDQLEDRDRVMQYLADVIKQKMAYINRYKEFRVIDGAKLKHRIFNFEVYAGAIPTDIKPFQIIDGERYSEYDRTLQLFDEQTDFNYGQYQIEHASSEKNVLVKAGAGTGKTYSMVSRIGFLYYSNHYKPEDLLKAVIMITFTNEAADNMKIRLKQYFTSLAILTEDITYMRIMENISHMQISTIHALMKKIIEKYARYLGVGSKVDITTETFERRQVIHEILNEEIIKPENQIFIQRGIRKYEIRKAVEKLLDLLEKKNIDLQRANRFAPIGTEPELFELILRVATKAQQQITKKHIQQNKIHLSNLSIEVKILLDALERETNLEEVVKYIFIDEFQDTDDVTIELIQRFEALFKFNVFVVGDIKQSIYRFRGADDEAFNKLAMKIHNWVIDEKIDSKTNQIIKNEYLSLKKNYRSDGKLLDDFNEIFMKWAEGIQGYSKVFKYQADDRLTNSAKDLRIKKPITKIDCTPDKFPREIASLITSQIEDLKIKYVNSDKEKGTIAILTRDNEQITWIREVEQYLPEGYYIETDKVQNLYKEPCTIDLYRLVLALQYHTNEKYLYSLSQSNYAPTISRKVVYLNYKNRGIIKQAYKEDYIIKEWLKTKNPKERRAILHSLKEQSVLRVIRRIIKETKPWERYAMQFPEDSREREEAQLNYKRNLDLLLERLIKQSNQEFLTLNGLAKQLYIKIFANQHQDERREEKQSDRPRIKCVTVHKSKGLEYDHVIIPYTGTSMTNRFKNEVVIVHDQLWDIDEIYVSLVVRAKKDSMQTPQQGIYIKSEAYESKTKKEVEDLIKEETRVLYVALTRAKDTVTWFDGSLPDQGEEVDIAWRDLLE